MTSDFERAPGFADQTRWPAYHKQEPMPIPGEPQQFSQLESGDAPVETGVEPTEIHAGERLVEAREGLTWEGLRDMHFPDGPATDEPQAPGESGTRQ